MYFYFPSSAFFYINAGVLVTWHSVGDTASSADGASSPAKGDCAKSIGISIATKNTDYRVIQTTPKLTLSGRRSKNMKQDQRLATL